MTRCVLTITNPLGLHARAAARFVHAASRFVSQIRLATAEREMDGKSIMGLLLLAAAQGTVVTLITDGADEAAASAALCGLIERGFEEVVCS